MAFLDLDFFFVWEFWISVDAYDGCATFTLAFPFFFWLAISVVVF